MKSILQCLVGLIGAVLFAVSLLLLAPSVGIAQNDNTVTEPRKPGLLWNRTGLPLVFPLQVKTIIGQNYVLTLLLEDTRDEVFAAYIEGGKFFRVLVPPGTFILRFTKAKIGQKDGKLVTPDIDDASFDLSKPLTFKIRGFNTKAGHIVDLRDIDGGSFANAIIKDQAICQGVYVEFDPSPGAEPFAQGALANGSHARKDGTVFLNDPISQRGLYPRIDQDMRARRARALPSMMDPAYPRFGNNRNKTSTFDRSASIPRPDPYRFDQPMAQRPAQPAPGLKKSGAKRQRNVIYSRYCG